VQGDHHGSHYGTHGENRSRTRAELCPSDPGPAGMGDGRGSHVTMRRIRHRPMSQPYNFDERTGMRARSSAHIPLEGASSSRWSVERVALSWRNAQPSKLKTQQARARVI